MKKKKRVALSTCSIIVVSRYAYDSFALKLPYVSTYYVMNGAHKNDVELE
jgi:hypothetical protein